MKKGVYDHPFMIVEVTEDRVFVYPKNPMIADVGYCMVNQYGDTGTMLVKVDIPKPTVKIGEGEMTEEERESLSKLEGEHLRGALVENMVRKSQKETD